MVQFVKVLTFAILAPLASASIIFAQANPVKPTFSLTISAPNTEVTLGGEVSIEIRQTNLSEQTIDCSAQVDSGVNYNFKYDVRDQHGTAAAKVVRAHPELGPAASYQGCNLPPGKSHTSGSLLSRIYQFNQPGEYTIQVSRPDTGNPGGGIVKSNTITITVLPEGERPKAKPQDAAH
jgi:hypothetical protein